MLRAGSWDRSKFQAAGLDAAGFLAKSDKMACARFVLFAGLLLCGACGPGAPGEGDTSSGGAGSSGAGGSSGDVLPTTGDGTSGGSTQAGMTTEPGSGSEGSSGGEQPACAYAVQPVAGLIGERIVAGDFDLDGAMDVASQPASGSVQLFFGDGTGLTFAGGDVVDIGAGGGSMARGDFDGDGRLDLVHYDFSFAEEVRVQLNLGGALGPGISTAVNALFYTARVADVDLDGDSDFSWGGFHSEPVHVLLSDGGALVDTHLLTMSACYATASAWADFDADGDVDFAVIGDCNAILGEPPIAVHLRDGGGYVAIPEAGRALSADTSVLLAGDVDGDGSVDIVTQGGRDPWAFERHLGNGDGTFATREEFLLPAGAMVVTGLDANADGRIDLLTAGDEGVVLLQSTGPGFEPCEVGPGAFAEVADFTGDGVMDVLLRQGDEFALAQRS